jgi:hypothetical protein
MILGKNIKLTHFFILFNMNYDLIHKFSLTRSQEPEPNSQYTGSSSGSGQKFRLLAAPAPAPAPQHCINSCTFVTMVTITREFEDMHG